MVRIIAAAIGLAGIVVVVSLALVASPALAQVTKCRTDRHGNVICGTGSNTASCTSGGGGPRRLEHCEQRARDLEDEKFRTRYQDRKDQRR